MTQVKALLKAGVPLTLYTVKGAGHGHFTDSEVPKLTRVSGEASATRQSDC